MGQESVYEGGGVSGRSESSSGSHPGNHQLDALSVDRPGPAT